MSQKKKQKILERIYLPRIYLHPKIAAIGYRKQQQYPMTAFIFRFSSNQTTSFKLVFNSRKDKVLSNKL